MTQQAAEVEISKTLLELPLPMRDRIYAMADRRGMFVRRLMVQLMEVGLTAEEKKEAAK